LAHLSDLERRLVRRRRVGDIRPRGQAQCKQKPGCPGGHYRCAHQRLHSPPFPARTTTSHARTATRKARPPCQRRLTAGCPEGQSPCYRSTTLSRRRKGWGQCRYWKKSTITQLSLDPEAWVPVTFT